MTLEAGPLLMVSQWAITMGMDIFVYESLSFNRGSNLEPEDATFVHFPCIEYLSSQKIIYCLSEEVLACPAQSGRSSQSQLVPPTHDEGIILQYTAGFRYSVRNQYMELMQSNPL